MNIPSASQVSLRADPDYIALLSAESTWPFKYRMGSINPTAPRAHPIQGLNAPAVGPGQIDAYNRLLPVNFRMDVRSSQHRPQTQLFGTAPYIALGRGVMHHVDTNSMLQQGNPLFDRGNRTVTERRFDTMDFVTIPEDLRQLPELRKGQMTRMGPQYIRQPHD